MTIVKMYFDYSKYEVHKIYINYPSKAMLSTTEECSMYVVTIN